MARLLRPIWSCLSVRFQGRTLGTLVSLALLLGLLAGVGGCNGGFEGAKPQPPLIISQPVSVTVTAGQTATFNVTATGTGPLTYQWYVNGVAIPARLPALIRQHPLRHRKMVRFTP